MSFRRPLTVTRKAGVDTYVKGVLVPGADGPLTITASVQPTKPDEMQLLPEGRRDSESFRLYTSTRLLTATDDTKKNADTVSINGFDYEVLYCATWQNNVINHYKALVVKL